MEKAKTEKEEAEAAGVEPAVRRPVPWEETAMNAATYGKMTPQQIEQELKQAASPQHGPIAMR